MSDDIEYFFCNGTLWVVTPDSDKAKEIPQDNILYQMILDLTSEDKKIDFDVSEYMPKEDNVKD